MGMLRTHKYRLYPTPVQVTQLLRILNLCRELYNAALTERREAYRKAHKSISYQDQSGQLPACKEVYPELDEVHSQVLQDVLRRGDKGFKAFFRRIRSGEIPGYPRFRSRDRYDSFTYPQTGFKWVTDTRLKLTKIGTIKVRKHRPMPAGKVKTCTVRREGSKWYVCLTVDIGEKPALRPVQARVGVDLGIKVFAKLSTDQQIPNPRCLDKSSKQLAGRQRVLARKKRGSRNRQRAKESVAKTHRKIRDQRADFQHKTSKQLVTTYDLIVVEKLDIRKMLESGGHSLHRNIADVAWNQFTKMLEYKAEEAGATIAFVDPRDTSQACSGCKLKVPKKLADRVHRCPYCGLELDRDLNAAINILNKYLAGAQPSSGHQTAREAYELQP